MKEHEPGKSIFNNLREVLFSLILCLTFLWAFYFAYLSTAQAQCYRLVDNRGTIHFTDTIYRWVNDKGEVYYTNYIVFLPPEKYLATVKEIKPAKRRGDVGVNANYFSHASSSVISSSLACLGMSPNLHLSLPPLSIISL